MSTWVLGERLVVWATIPTLALSLTMVDPALASDTAPPPVAQLLAWAGEQVRRFERDFALVVSDEDYRQHAIGHYSVDSAGERIRRFQMTNLHRRTRSEMLFMWLPDEAVWLTVRNVLTADGRTVSGNPSRLHDALRDERAERLPRLRRLVDDSARFNLGRTFRNFNYPTQVLAYLDPALQPRFAFTLVGRQRVSGIDAWKVKYEERATPTVIQGNGADRRSRGAVWIADRDAAIVRTRLDLTMPSQGVVAAVSVEVEYQRDMKLDIWVPFRMHETYLETQAGTISERVGCEATYSNFRRFETSGRILEAK